MSSVLIPATFAQAFALTLNVQGSGGGQTGLTPTVRIRDARTTDNYLDFADLTFKTGGWSTKDAPLAEIGLGRYLRVADGDPAGDDPYLWTLGGSQPPAVPAYFALEFDVTGLGGVDDALLVTAHIAGQEFDYDLDTTGLDTLGWQEVHTSKGGREMRRLNLYTVDGRATGLADNLDKTIIRRELI